MNLFNNNKIKQNEKDEMINKMRQNDSDEHREELIVCYVSSSFENRIRKENRIRIFGCPFPWGKAEIISSFFLSFVWLNGIFR